MVVLLQEAMVIVSNLVFKINDGGWMLAEDG